MSTPQEAYTALRRAGASAADATLLTAIGGAESGWNLNAVGDVALEDHTWGPSFGIWQIRTLIAETGKGTPRDINRLRTGIDAQAAAALAVKGSQGLRAWSTYTSGAYSGYVGQANNAASRAGASASAPASASPAAYTGAGTQNVGFSIPNPLNLLGNAAGTVGGDVASGLWAVVSPFVMKAMFAIGGITLVVVGLSVAAKPITQPITEKVNETADKAMKAGEMAAVAG